MNNIGSVKEDLTKEKRVSVTPESIKKFIDLDQKKTFTLNSFEKLRDKFEITKIFKSISKYSKNSEIRYVGGCIRKILNKEKIDDIDLAVNLKHFSIINFFSFNHTVFYIFYSIVFEINSS